MKSLSLLLLAFLSAVPGFAGQDLSCESIEYIGIRAELQIRGGEAILQKRVDDRVVSESRMLIAEATPSVIAGNGFLLQLNDTQDGPNTNALLEEPKFDQGFLNLMFCR